MIKKSTTTTEFKQARLLSEYAFNKVVDPKQRDCFYFLCEHADVWGFWSNEQLASQLLTYPFEVTLGGRPFKMIGVGHVASYPEYRNQGLIRQLFAASLKQAKEQNVALSYLAPFSYNFYRKFGYETCFKRKKILISTEKLARFPYEKAGTLVRMDWQNIDMRKVVQQLYKETLGKRNASLVREDWWWEFTIKHYPKREIALYLDEHGCAQGYVIYERQSPDFIIHELAYRDLFAFKKLNGFISSHCGTFSHFYYITAENEPWPFSIQEEHDYEQQLEPYMMARIVDLKTFLSDYPFQTNTEQTFTIQVKDEFCEWNDGYFRITTDGTKTSVTTIANEIQPDYQADIQTWTQLFMGYLPFSEALFCEKLQAKSNLLQSLLLTETPALHDYF